MNRLLMLACFFISIPGILAAQTGGYYTAKSNCNLRTFQDENTSVTFYGDSRGDYIDELYWGVDRNGWSTYLDFGAERDWNVQNLAVVNYTIGDLYNHIVSCTFIHAGDDVELNTEYITATRYAFEIGGNDAVLNSFYLLMAPWRFNRSAEYINRGQGVIVDLLIAELASRNVENPSNNILMIGSFPAVSHGITTGTPSDGCFKNPIVNSCIGHPMKQCLWQGDISGTIKHCVRIEKNSFDVSQFSVYVTDPLSGVLESVSSFVNTLFNTDVSLGQESPVPWFEQWALWVSQENSGLTIASMLLANVADGERVLASQKGIHYLYTYTAMSLFPKDAIWVANPYFFTELAHNNFLGYSVLGYQVGSWMAENGWDKPYSAPVPPLISFVPPDPPQSTVPEWDWMDLVLWCYFAEYCKF